MTAGTTPCDLTEAQPERLTCAFVETNLLNVLGLSVAAGRDFLPFDGKQGTARVALITHGLWLRRFAGNPEVVGRLLVIDGRSVQVVGVLPPAFELPTLAAADVLFAQQLSPTPAREESNAANYPTPERQIAFFEQLLQATVLTPGTLAAAITDSLPPAVACSCWHCKRHS